MTVLPAPEIGREKESEREREREREKERRRKYREKGNEKNLDNWQIRGRNSRERTSFWVAIGEAQRQVGHMVHMQTISQHNNFSYFLTVESAALLICCITCRFIRPTTQRKRDSLSFGWQKTHLAVWQSPAQDTSLATTFKLIKFCGWLSSLFQVLADTGFLRSSLHF